MRKEPTITADRPSRRTTPAAARWTFDALSLLALCMALLAAIVLIVAPLLTGSQTYTVLTNSMAPAYPPGTYLVVQPTDVNQLRTGDVVTYQIASGRPEVITHRITGFLADQEGERLFVTKGDNNDVADRPVQAVQVRGKLLYAVPYVGFLANALGHTDRGLAVTALAVLLIGWGIAMIARDVATSRAHRPASAMRPNAERSASSGAAIPMLARAEVP